MKISGLWSGQFQSNPLDGSSPSHPYTFSVAIKRDWLGRIQGPVDSVDLPGLPAEGHISGAARWGRISFNWMPGNPYYFDGAGFQPLHTPGQEGATMPIDFSGKINSQSKNAAGEWQITTWWMERKTNRKIKIVLLQGSWTMKKTRDYVS